MALRKIRPQSTHHYGKRTAFRQQLEQATHIRFLQGRWKPLQHLYIGSHEMIRRENEHVYVIHRNGRDVALSIEKLKPVFLFSAEEILELSQEE